MPLKSPSNFLSHFRSAIYFWEKSLHKLSLLFKYKIIELKFLYLDRFITRPRLASVPLKASSNFLSHFHKLSLPYETWPKSMQKLSLFENTFQENNIWANIKIIIFANVWSSNTEEQIFSNALGYWLATPGTFTYQSDYSKTVSCPLKLI